MKYKKIFIIYILCIFFLPIIVKAEDCDISKLTITSVEKNNIKGNTKELEEPTFNNRNISFNLKMYNVEDSITYDITIKNDSKEDYKIDESTFKTNSEYILYTLKTNDNSNVIKSKSTKNVSLIIEYKKAVDDSILDNNSYDASNNLIFSLNNSLKEKELDYITTNNIKNPLTVNNLYLILFIILITSLLVYLTIHNKKKYNKYLIIILTISFIPVVYAACKCDIEVESKIVIAQKPKLSDELINLANDNTCIVKYNGNVTDEVNNTVPATKVYFNKCEDKRNVIFGGFCWQVIRTTETGGTKILYNGEPVDGKCENTRPMHKGVRPGSSGTQTIDTEYLYGSSFTINESTNEFVLQDTFTSTWSDSTSNDLIGKYTCKTNGNTCTILYYIDEYNSSNRAQVLSFRLEDTNYSQLGVSYYNPNSMDDSISSVGYMYNVEYRTVSNRTVDGAYYGNDVTYNNGVYTLVNPQVGLDENHHYTCNSTDPSGTCASVRYYYYGTYYHIVLTDGKKVEDAINEMLYADDVNKYDSTIKKFVDNWYSSHLVDYTNKLEDVVYCNNRIVTDMGSFNPNGGSTNGNIVFISYPEPAPASPRSDLTCQNITDQFAVSNSKAKLKYPIALLTQEERVNFNPVGNLLLTEYYGWWFMTPLSMYQTGGGMSVSNQGPSAYSVLQSVSSYDIGIRPVISLAPNTKISSGTGIDTDPWIIK